MTWWHFWSFSLAACIDTWQGSCQRAGSFPAIIKLTFCPIECGIYQISICTMISLFIRSVNSSKMLRNLPLDLLIEFLPLPCYVEQATIVTYRYTTTRWKVTLSYNMEMYKCVLINYLTQLHTVEYLRICLTRYLPFECYHLIMPV